MYRLAVLSLVLSLSFSVTPYSLPFVPFPYAFFLPSVALPSGGVPLCARTLPGNIIQDLPDTYLPDGVQFEAFE